MPLRVSTFQNSLLAALPGVGPSQWQQGTWQALAPLPPSTINAMVEHEGILYASGMLRTEVATSSVNTVVRLVNGAWEQLPSASIGVIRDMCFLQDDLYVTGSFTSLAGVPAKYVARWDGSAWHAVGTGLDNDANCIAVWHGDVYVGGRFAYAGDAPAQALARWDGSRWSSVGDFAHASSDAVVYSLLPHHDRLIAGGRWMSPAGQPTRALAAWDGLAWSTVAEGLQARAGGEQTLTLASDGDDVLVGGKFSTAGSAVAASYARLARTPPDCLSDFDCSGGIDGGDIDPYFQLWIQADPWADLNHDDSTDAGDMQRFFEAWEAGC